MTKELPPKLISAFSPSVPMWAVYYDERLDDLWTTPVVALGIIGRYEYCNYRQRYIWERVLEPLTFGCDGLSQAWGLPVEDNRFLGFALEETPKLSDFEDEIIFYKKRRSLKNEQFAEGDSNEN